MDRIFNSSITGTRYCLHKAGNALCLFKEAEDGSETPVLGKVYDKDSSGNFNSIRRFMIRDEDFVIPTTTIHRRDKIPVGFVIHRDYGRDIYAALMNGTVVSAVEHGPYKLRAGYDAEQVPMARKLFFKLRKYFKI